MIARKLHIFLGILVFLLPFLVIGQQEVKIELTKKNLQLNEVFSIKVIIKNADKWEVKNLPELQGMNKAGTAVAHTLNAVNGQKISTHTFTQNYTATKEGSYKIAPFSLQVNGEEVKSDGSTIVINKLKEESIDENPILTNIDSKEDAFLSLSTDKSKVYVSEGVKVTIGFYVAKTNTAEMNFPDDLELQLGEISKKIQSSDCLEERLNIANIVAVPTILNGKQFDFYKVFEAIYYPLNTKPITFPSVTLRMVKVRNNKQKEFRPFSSNSLIIKPLALPEHPLKNKVVAGNFYLFEKIDAKTIETGKSFKYSFRIVGNGNFSTVNLPPISNDSYFDFYSPEIKSVKEQGKINGEKDFRYQVVAKEAGEKTLDKYFYWVFFNTKTERYDTLKSKLKIVVSGQKISENVGKNSEDIYEGIDKLDTTAIETDYRAVLKNITNFLVITMLVVTMFLLVFKKKKKEF